MALTLRKLPPEVEREIIRTAANDKTSRCRAAVGLLERAVSGRKHSVVHHDLDRLAGSWNAKEARSFDTALKKQRA